MNLILNKEIEINEKNLKAFSTSFESLEEFIHIQTEEIFKFYDKFFSSQSFEITEKFKILLNVLEKIDYASIEKMKSEIEADRKLIESKKSEIQEKRKVIENKIKTVESKLNKIVSKDPRIIERHFILKNLLTSNLKEVNNIKKTSEEVKTEFKKILREEIDKKGIFKESFNPKLIKADLIEKQISFEENLRGLEKDIINSIDRLNE